MLLLGFLDNWVYCMGVVANFYGGCYAQLLTQSTTINQSIKDCHSKIIESSRFFVIKNKLLLK